MALDQEEAFGELAVRWAPGSDDRGTAALDPEAPREATDPAAPCPTDTAREPPDEDLPGLADDAELAAALEAVLWWSTPRCRRSSSRRCSSSR